MEQKMVRFVSLASDTLVYVRAEPFLTLQTVAAMESCPVKTAMAGGAGFALGGAFGLFMSSVSLRKLFLCVSHLG